jgi:endonuclease VIII
VPEGDTIYRAARTLHHALAGQTVTRFQTELAPLAQLDRAEPIAGRTVERVEAAGKHVLMTFSPSTPGPPPLAADTLILRTHMRMNGSWHIYRPGEPWRMPARAMRILIETSEWVAVAFNVYVAEFIRVEDRSRHRPLAALGPDLLGDFDADRAMARIREQGGRPLHDVLLDQRVMAGLGNVYKSEVLFLSRLHPDTPADRVGEPAWRELMRLAQSLLKANVSDGTMQIVTYRGLRRTTGRMNPEDRVWVYSRGGQPCRKCGTPIASRRDGDAARVTYWCPTCQTLPE